MSSSRCKKCGKKYMTKPPLRGGLGAADHLEEPTSAAALLGGLASLRDASMFVDCVLELGELGELIPIHAVVGAARSGFILGSLLHGGRTAQYEGRAVRSIRIPVVGSVLGAAIPAAGVRALVEFWYTDKMELGGLQDVADLWSAADFFITWTGVADRCCDQARLLLSIDTWAEVWTLGLFYSRPELRQAAVEYATSRFKKAASHRWWVRAPLGAVQELLRQELLHSSEDEVMSAALSWVEGAKAGADALAELLSVVRLPQVSGAALARLRLHPLVAGSAACQGLLDEAAAWVPPVGAEGEAGGRLWGPRAAHRWLVVVKRGQAQRYDVSTNTWSEMPPPVIAQICAAGASLDGRVYVAGGKVWPGWSAHVTCFDPAAANGAGAWVEVAPMGSVRRHAAAASLHGLLYVAGGTDHEESFVRTTVERYSPASDSWEAVASMTSARCSHQLVALGGFLYAIGGDIGSSAGTAERYDPATNTWTPIASMASGRSDSAAAAMGGFLYVTGGTDYAGTNPRSCERYDPASNTWSSIADMPEPRHGHALACLGGSSLYAVGGAGYASTSPPSRYDVLENTWVVVSLAPGSAEMRDFESSAWASV